MFNIAIAQSGGPTCAINASLSGIFSEALKYSKIDKIYGSFNGINGILNKKLIDLKNEIKNNEDLYLLKHTPATVLGSCRKKLPECSDDSSCYKKIFDVFNKHNIQAFFYIGGNNSMDTVKKLSEYAKTISSNIKIMGVPKTIDNDVMATDHTPGFGSAAKYITSTVSEIVRDSIVYDVPSVTIIEIMGRDAGWLTASTSLLRKNGSHAPQLIYLPEKAFSVEKFVEDIKKLHQTTNSVIVAASEGLKNEAGDYVANGHISDVVDVFGHKYLAGLGKYLENIVKTQIGCKVRSIELNVMQRCASHMASKTDLDEAELIGQEALKEALKGETGKMMAFKRISNNPYRIEIESVKIDNIANKEKFFPAEWINTDNNNVTDEAIEYFLPLIQGEVLTPMKNGMPIHFHLTHKK